MTVYDVGRHGDSAYVVMDLLEGETLRKRLASGGLRLRKTLDYATQIAEALAAAHERGVVHRDLKPENVFLTADGRLRVLDFGLAQLAPSSAWLPAEIGSQGTSHIETMAPVDARPTGPDTIVGTVEYMAPEQARGQTVDGRADIFSLGAVLYEMVAGRRAGTVKRVPGGHTTNVPWTRRR